MSHCAPCTWMNGVMKKGAYALMRGRGGLRARVVHGGTLVVGDTALWSEVNLDIDPLTPLRVQKFPSF